PWPFAFPTTSPVSSMRRHEAAREPGTRSPTRIVAGLSLVLALGAAGSALVTVREWRVAQASSLADAGDSQGWAAGLARLDALSARCGAQCDPRLVAADAALRAKAALAGPA